MKGWLNSMTAFPLTNGAQLDCLPPQETPSKDARKRHQIAGESCSQRLFHVVVHPCFTLLWQNSKHYMPSLPSNMSYPDMCGARLVGRLAWWF